MLKLIDIHAHILPGVDDGCRSEEESLRLMEAAKIQGVRGIIATPHYSRRDQHKDLQEVYTESAERLNQIFGDQVILGVGHETFWHEDLPERLLEGYALSLASSNFLLMEYDPGVSYQTMVRSVRDIVTVGYIPVLAHIERYVCLREVGRVREVRSMGARLQINWTSLGGSVFDQEARWCRNQVKEGWIDFLATDMHRPSFRPPEIRRATAWLEKALGTKRAEEITYQNPMLILDQSHKNHSARKK